MSYDNWKTDDSLYRYDDEALDAEDGWWANHQNIMDQLIEIEQSLADFQICQGGYIKAGATVYVLAQLKEEELKHKIEILREKLNWIEAEAR